MAYHQNNDMEYFPDELFNMSEFEYDNPFEDDPPADVDYGNDDVVCLFFLQPFLFQEVIPYI